MKYPMRHGNQENHDFKKKRNAENMGTARLLKLLDILGVEMVLDRPEPLPSPESAGNDAPNW